MCRDSFVVNPISSPHPGALGPVFRKRFRRKLRVRLKITHDAPSCTPATGPWWKKSHSRRESLSPTPHPNYTENSTQWTLFNDRRRKKLNSCVLGQHSACHINSIPATQMNNRNYETVTVSWTTLVKLSPLSSLHIILQTVRGYNLGVGFASEVERDL